MIPINLIKLSVSHGGMHVIRKDDNVNARLANLTRKVEATELRKVGKEKIMEKGENICSICDTSGHMAQDCPTILAFREVLYE